MDNPVIYQTEDGSDTLFMADMNEHYHSVHGAISESFHIFINGGYRFFIRQDHIKVLEIGFGTGLNCLLTALEAIRLNIQTEYFTIEKYPLTEELTGKLNYPALTGKTGNEIFQKIHASPWNEKVTIAPRFELIKLDDDFLTISLESIREVDVIYFDAFAPVKQPDMWTNELFRKLCLTLKPGGILLTFSAKGSVRRSLVSAGFVVERLPGPKGKREILRAIKRNIGLE